MDYEDFVYTVTSNVDQWDPAQSLPVRKQTALGHNILKVSPVLEYPIGDIEYLNSSEETDIIGPSKFVDVAASESYGYACLDAKRKRIFVYNDDGEILFIFGGEGSVFGTMCAVGIITVVSNSMLLMGIDTYWQDFFNGLVILIGVTVSALQAMRRKN